MTIGRRDMEVLSMLLAKHCIPYNKVVELQSVHDYLEDTYTADSMMDVLGTTGGKDSSY